jgi:predicted membrane protein
VFGGAELDLREARLESHEVTIDVKAVFGGVDIVVPDDVIAIVDGTAVFGGFDDKVSTNQPATGAPVVRIGGKAVFGGVSVHRRPGDSTG